jgi:hypothetical protein
MKHSYKETAMKLIIKAAPLVLVVVLAACLNPAEPAEPDLDLYYEVNYSGQNPGSTFAIGDFFIVPASGAWTFDLSPGAVPSNYIDVTLQDIFKDHAQAIQAVKDSFKFNALGPLTTGGPTYQNYTPYPEGADIPIKSAAVTETGQAIRITLDLPATVSNVIQLRISAEKLEGARGEKIDTNQNLIAGEPEDDLYYNYRVNGPSVAITAAAGTGVTRNRWRIINVTGAYPAILNAPGLAFTTRPDDAYDVKANVTWNYAKSQGYLDEDSYITQALGTHVIVEKFTKTDDEASWAAAPGAWAIDPLTAVATFTVSAPAGDFDIYRLNLKDRDGLETQGEYYGFKQKLMPVTSHRKEVVLQAPTIPTPAAAKFISAVTPVLADSYWTNDKGGWLDLTLPGTVVGVDPATLVKENFRLYAATGQAAGVLSPLRGIPVDSVSQYVDATNAVHLIIKLDPNYKRVGNFASGYGNSGQDADYLQIWIGKEVKVYDTAGAVKYLGSGASILADNGIEDFFSPYGYEDASDL